MRVDHVTSCLQTVNAKKLEKAEAKLKAKLDRRTERDVLRPTAPM